MDSHHDTQSSEWFSNGYKLNLFKGHKLNRSPQAEQLFDRSWCRFPYDESIASWVSRAEPHARQVMSAAEFSNWLRSGETWFAGVNALPNDEAGCIDGDNPLAGTVVEFIQRELHLPELVWDRAQVSVVYPGYPIQMSDESDAAYHYRVRRDAAHVDGIERVGSTRRRFLSEHHAFVLGLPLTSTAAGASPLVVWEGSHEVVRGTFLNHFGNTTPDKWCEEDITTLYHETRKQIFTKCDRVVVMAQPGEAYITHRLALHGIQPWNAQTAQGLQERMICYFRPPLLDAFSWLHAP